MACSRLELRSTGTVHSGSTGPRHCQVAEQHSAAVHLDLEMLARHPGISQLRVRILTSTDQESLPVREQKRASLIRTRSDHKVHRHLSTPRNRTADSTEDLLSICKICIMPKLNVHRNE